MNVIEFISQPWHWAVSGIAIAMVMFLLIYFGQQFGVSSSFKAVCSLGGAGRAFSYFRYDWKSHDWLLVFVIGSMIGGGIAVTWLASPEPVNISTATIAALQELGLQAPGEISAGYGLMPSEIFNFSKLASLSGIILMVLGGMLIGFGTRWAGGCTSGHAITGLSNLQLPSLVAVIGFFIGGMITTYFLLPILLG